MNTYTGIVQKGTKRAGALGFPTLNIPLGEREISGIYVARVVVEGRAYNAASFADQKRKVLEAYVLDFPPHELYGEEVTIELHERIRDSVKFENDAALQSAINNDVAKVRKYFKKSV